MNDKQTTEAQENPDFLITAQLLKRIPISRRTLHVWKTKGIIPSVQLGHKILYHWPSVQAALIRKQDKY